MISNALYSTLSLTHEKFTLHLTYFSLKFTHEPTMEIMKQYFCNKRVTKYNKIHTVFWFYFNVIF